MITISQNSNFDSIKQNRICSYSKKITAYFSDIQTAKIECELKKLDKDLTLEKLITAEIKDLIVIRDELARKKGCHLKTKSRLSKLFLKAYTKFRDTYGVKFVIDLGLTVCPYCNRNYINNTNNRTTSQFDHFISKTKYPLFAVSVFNLIPCCYACNHIKHDSEIIVSPHGIDLTDDLVHFGYIFTSQSNIEIEIKACKPEMESNLKVFKLRELYQIHNDVAKEIIYKAQCYNKNYIESLFGLIPQGMSLSVDELYYGNYLQQKDYHKRPLSKMTKDIIDDTAKLVR